MGRFNCVVLLTLTALACGGSMDSPLAVAPPEASLVPAEITVMDLGAGRAVDINDLGQVLQTDASYLAPFLWDAEAGMTSLPLHSASAVNNLGQVAGMLDGSPTIWDPAVGLIAIDEGTFSLVAPRDLNDLGQVVGFTVVGSSNLTQEFLWDATSGLTTLAGVDGVDDVAFGINHKTTTNNFGQVVGRFRNPSNGEVHAFFWDPAGGMIDLGTLPGGAFSEALAINDLGQVVGRSRTGTGGPCPGCGFDYRPFLWELGTGMVDLGTLGGSSGAADINNLGQVVGYWGHTSEGGRRAFLWDAVAGMTDLGTLPGAVYANANAINDLGQVVGESTTETQEVYAALWTTLRLATPAEETEILTAAIEQLEADDKVPHGQATALLATIASANRLLGKGNTTAACNILQAFVHQVEAFLDAGQLSDTDAQALIDAAENAITQLGC